MTDKLKLRPISANDIEQITELDHLTSGESRRGFFEKRFESQQRDPDGYISLAAIENGSLGGFLLARILDGEFGHRERVAVLDAVGVHPERQGRGIGRTLMNELDRIMTSRGAVELHTQTEWNQPGIMDFFSAMGFALAPRLVLERSTDNLDF